MEIEIDLNQSVEENAGTYYNLAKKAKKKLEGARKALADTNKRLEKLQQEEHQFLQQEEQKRTKQQSQRKKEWYEKFHWFVSSEGFFSASGMMSFRCSITE